MTRPEILGSADFHRVLFDALPLYVFVLDPDVRIRGCNAAARALFGGEARDVLSRPGGQALSCINQSRSPKGCGHSDECKSCVIRNSVKEAVSGRKVFRNKCRMVVLRGDERQELHMLVTASPFVFQGDTHVLLILEDINELIQLRSFLPICASCKRIRNEANLWEDVEAYIGRNADVDFTHSLCEECEEKLYPGARDE